jgi:creatinine amidohydrolase/Fe(II)-dependent formamide hydrolase-like protein
LVDQATEIEEACFAEPVIFGWSYEHVHFPSTIQQEDPQ